ncbi:hypothetical protein GCM10010388_61630 [Streptomyces mauvecolor]
MSMQKNNSVREPSNCRQNSPQYRAIRRRTPARATAIHPPVAPACHRRFSESTQWPRHPYAALQVPPYSHDLGPVQGPPTWASRRGH